MSAKSLEGLLGGASLSLSSHERRVLLELGLYFLAFVVAVVIVADMVVAAWESWGILRHLFTGILTYLAVPPEVVYLVPAGFLLGVVAALAFDTYKRAQGFLLWIGLAVAVAVVLLPNGVLFDLLDGEFARLGLGLAGVAFVLALWRTGVIPGIIRQEAPYEFPRAPELLTTAFWILAVYGLIEAHVEYRGPLFARPEGLFPVPFQFQGLVLGEITAIRVGAVLLGAFALSRFVEYEQGRNVLVIGPQRSGKTAAFGGLMIALEDEYDEPMHLRRTNLDDVRDAILEGQFPESNRPGDKRVIRLPFTMGRLLPRKIDIESVDFAGEDLRGILHPLLEGKPTASLDTGPRRYGLDVTEREGDEPEPEEGADGVGPEGDTHTSQTDGDGRIKHDGGDPERTGSDADLDRVKTRVVDEEEEAAVSDLERVANESDLESFVDEHERYLDLLESPRHTIRRRAAAAIVRLNRSIDGSLIPEMRTVLDGTQRGTIREVLQQGTGAVAPDDEESTDGADGEDEPGDGADGDSDSVDEDNGSENERAETDSGGRFDQQDDGGSGGDVEEDETDVYRSDSERFTQKPREKQSEVSYENIDYEDAPTTWGDAVDGLRRTSPQDESNLFKYMWGCVQAADRIAVLVPIDDFVGPLIAAEVSEGDAQLVPPYYDVGAFSEFPPSEEEQEAIASDLREKGYEGLVDLKVFREGPDEVYWTANAQERSDQPTDYLRWYHELVKEYRKEKDVMIVGTMADWVVPKYTRSRNTVPENDYDAFCKYVYDEVLPRKTQDVLAGSRDDYPHLLWYNIDEGFSPTDSSNLRIDTSGQNTVLRGAREVIERLSE
jgi:hypothetical protein